MDFDDLDDEIEKRIADGEEVLCHVIENNQPYQGALLPLMERTDALPSFQHLPDRFKKDLPPWNGKTPAEKRPVLRLLCIHGAADSYEQDWYKIENSAPPDIEVATYNWPGHGHRKDEPFLTTLPELVNECFETFREAMDTGSFAFLGHSIGALMAIMVSKRAKEELGVEPVCVIMSERGAANHPLFTDVGAQRLRTDPIPFFEYWNPLVYTVSQKLSGEQGKRTMDMWAIDQIMDQDSLEIGFHTFNCPILALQASHSINEILVIKEQTPEMLARLGKLAEVGVYKQKLPDGKWFNGHFPAWTYDDWSKWTQHPAGCKVVECPDTTHMTIKADDYAMTHVWEVLRRIIDRFRKE